LHTDRVLRSALLVVAMAACSGGPRRPGLPAAGSRGDDGSGQLAQASTRLLLGGDDSEPERRGRGRRGDGGPDDGGFGGSSYGGGGYGGGGYDVTSIGGIGFLPPAVRRSDYVGAEVTDGGVIEGVVRWPRPPLAAATAATACGRVAGTGPRRRASGEIEGAVVYLVSIARGRPFAGADTGRTLSVGGLVEHRDCGLWPRLQVVAPAPGAVVTSNADGAAVTLVGSGGIPFRAMLGAGDRRTVAAGAGVTQVRDADARLVPAWILGLGHPYHALTDAAGRFRIDQVPAGIYQLEVWHPPVSGTEPVVVRRTVTVATSARLRLALDLPPRP
jgi:hypothetical protein